MARISSSKDSTPTSYHLHSPPSRRLISPIAIVTRGRRHQVKLGVRACFAAGASSPSPTPTEPNLSPGPLADRQGLRRMYSFLDPTGTGVTDSTVVVPTPGSVGQHTPSSTPTHHGTLPVDVGAMGENILPSPHTPVSVAQPQPGSDQGRSTNSTPVTGLEIGCWGLFRTVNSALVGLQTFDQPMASDDFIHLRFQLDCSDGGLTSFQFRDMFGQCKGCRRYMLMRGKDYHKCPGMHALPQLAPAKRLFFLLNSMGGGGGLTRRQFHNLFASCITCSLVFTRAAAAHHFHSDDTEDL